MKSFEEIRLERDNADLKFKINVLDVLSRIEKMLDLVVMMSIVLFLIGLVAGITFGILYSRV